MGERTGIEWCHHTFNPWLGCTKVSAGCKHCYAERESLRFGKNVWGPSAPRQITKDNYWKQPIAWNKKAAAAGERRRVFSGSMCDVFEDLPELEEPRKRLLQLIDITKDLDWLLLTKRPENVLRLLSLAAHENLAGEDVLRHMPNVWIGTSVEDQDTADERIPELLKIPARVRFLSCEPLLGKILLDNGETSWLSCNGENRSGVAGEHACCESFAVTGHHFHGVDWVIAGGESGPHARPMHPMIAQHLRDQVVDADVPFFFKQWGEWQPIDEQVLAQIPIGSGDPPPVAAFSGVPVVKLADLHDVFAPPHHMVRVGKKAAGRMLDGVEWSQVPA